MLMCLLSSFCVYHCWYNSRAGLNKELHLNLVVSLQLMSSTSQCCAPQIVTLASNLTSLSAHVVHLNHSNDHGDHSSHIMPSAQDWKITPWATINQIFQNSRVSGSKIL